MVWIILGLTAGSAAKLFAPGTSGGGLISRLVVGIVGALAGGYLGAYFFGVPMTSTFENMGENLPGFLASISGAILALAVHRLTAGYSLER